MFTYHPIVAIAIKFTIRMNETVTSENPKHPISVVSIRMDDVTALSR